MSALADGLAAAWPYLTTAAGLLLALLASGHALLRKREVRASIGWLVVIWALPIGGALLYAALGINRLAARCAGPPSSRRLIRRWTMRWSVPGGCPRRSPISLPWSDWSNG